MKKVRLFILSIIFIFIGIIFGIYKTYASEQNYIFESKIYTIDNDYIRDISPNTSIDLYKGYFDYENCYILITNNNDSNNITNNSKTTVYSKDNIKLKEYTNIIVGDINSDSYVNDTDLSIYSKNIIEKNNDNSLDLDSDNKTNLSDIIILDKVLTDGVLDIDIDTNEFILQTDEISRIIAKGIPNYGVNTNLTYTSLDTNIAKVNENGIVTGGIEGETKIIVSSKDNNVSKEVTIKTDNTIQLESYIGTVYQGGNDKKVFIKSIDYNDITCSSESDAIDCSIDGKYLVLKPKRQISNYINVTVTSKNYGSVIYKVKCLQTNLSIAFTYVDCKTKGALGQQILSTLNAGKIEIDIKDKDVIKEAYTDKGRFYYRAGNKAGVSTINLKETNGNAQKIFTLYVYELKFYNYGMKLAPNDTYQIDYLHDGLGNVTCSSSDEKIATCEMKDGLLYVTTLTTGDAYIYLNNTITHHYDDLNIDENHSCGQDNILIAVREG